MSIEWGYCKVCGKKTDFYVTSDTVLCGRHHAQYEVDEEHMMEWYRNEHDRVYSRVRCLEEDMPSGGHNDTDSGSYIVTCTNSLCRVNFCVDDYYGGGLCPGCTRRAREMSAEIDALVSRLQSEYAERRETLNRKFGLR